MNTLHPYYLDQLGISRFVLKEPLKKSMLLLDALETKTATCTRCSLHKERTRTVFYRGNPHASLMIIGEAPGYHEDQQGKPFVGPAGELLNKMLHSIGLDETNVYIANVIKCRPPNNRDPYKEEIHACTAYLTQQITLVAPKLILGLGCFAGQFLTASTFTMQQLRSQSYQYLNIPCFITFHPAYLLRNPGEKKKAFLDLVSVKSQLCQL